MKNSTIKVKLKKSLVIEKLNIKLKEMKAEHTNLDKLYEKEKKAYEKWKQDILKKATKWELAGVDTYGSRVHLSFETTENVDFEREVCTSDVERSLQKVEMLQKQIQLLEMSIDETVPMSMLDNIVTYL